MGPWGQDQCLGAVSLGCSDLDFKSAEHDGWEIPWPFSYNDIAPYYDRVEQLIGVCGGNDDSDSLPGSKYYMPPPKLRCGEWLLKKAAGRVGIPIVNVRRAVLTRDHRGFPKCHHCGACGRGCDSASFFNSADHLLPFAMETGRLQLVSNAVPLVFSPITKVVLPACSILIDIRSKRLSSVERSSCGRILHRFHAHSS